VIY
jgi:hypothetical protein